MKAEVNKLDTAKLVNIPTSLNNLETKVDDSDVAKLKTGPVDLKNLSDVVNNEVVKNTKFNKIKTKVNNLAKKIPVDKKIFDVSGLVTTTVLNTKNSEGENKISDTSGLVTTTDLNIKIGEFQNKISNHAKCITTPEFNKIAAENFAARIKQDKKLMNL